MNTNSVLFRNGGESHPLDAQFKSQFSVQYQK